MHKQCNKLSPTLPRVTPLRKEETSVNRCSICMFPFFNGLCQNLLSEFSLNYTHLFNYWLSFEAEFNRWHSIGSHSDQNQVPHSSSSSHLTIQVTNKDILSIYTSFSSSSYVDAIKAASGLCQWDQRLKRRQSNGLTGCIVQIDLFCLLWRQERRP